MPGRKSELTQRSQRVLSIIEGNPSATYIDIECAIRTSTTGIASALRALEGAGYIQVIRAMGARNSYVVVRNMQSVPDDYGQNRTEPDRTGQAK